MYEKINTFALRLLRLKQYSSKELKGKLLKKFPDLLQDVDNVIERFKEIDLLNDRRLSESIVLGLSKRGFGPKRIKEKLRLRQLSINENSIATHEDLSLESLRHKLLRRFPILTSPGKIELKERLRIQNWILRRGFKFSIKEILSKGEYENEQSSP